MGAAFDLTGAYAGAAGKVIRRARFDAATGISRIEDDIASPAGTVVWRAFTSADIEIKGDDVILKKSGKQITLRKISSTGSWSVAEASPPTAQESQNKGFHAVVLTAPKSDRVELGVEIRP